LSLVFFLQDKQDRVDIPSRYSYFAWSEAEKFLNKSSCNLLNFHPDQMRHWPGQSAKIVSDNVYLENGNLNIYTWAQHGNKQEKSLNTFCNEDKNYKFKY